MSHLLVDTPVTGVTRITLNRPEILNALSRELVADFTSALTAASEDPACRVVIVTGAGQGFCSGQDMAAASRRASTRAAGVMEKLHWQRRFAGMARTMREMPQPVIAAVNGAAAGAGMAIALAADIRIVTPSAKFLVAAVRIGLSAGESGISYHLPRWIGAGRAFEVLLTGRPILADEALATGLAVRVVADAQLADASIQQAHAIMANSPFSVAETKRLMWRSLDAAGLDAALAIENPTQILASSTEDYTEALKAFTERRPPTFSGK